MDIKASTIAIIVGIYYLLTRQKVSAAEITPTPQGITPTVGITTGTQIQPIVFTENPITTDITIPTPSYDIPSRVAQGITTEVQPQVTIQPPIDVISIAPTTQPVISEVSSKSMIDQTYVIPTQKPTELKPIVSPTITITPQPIIPVGGIVPAIPVGPTVPVITPTMVITPTISGLLYVVNPTTLIKTLPIILYYNQTINEKAGNVNSLYTLYDVTKPIPELSSAKLISQYSTPEFASVFSYYDDLLKTQITYYNDRQGLLAERAKTGNIPTSNEKMFFVLNLIIDKQTYNNLDTASQSNYIPIETYKLPTSVSVLTDVVQIPSTPGSYVGPLYTPNDGKTHTYRILGQDYKYNSGNIFGFIRTIDNAIVEFSLNDIYGSYNNRGVQGAFQYAADIFLNFLSKKKFIEIATYSQAPMWGTLNIYGRTVNSPAYRMEYYIMGNDPGFAKAEIDNLAMAKKYDVPIETIVSFITGYNDYIAKSSSGSISYQVYYADTIMKPTPVKPTTIAGWTDYYSKVEVSLKEYLQLLSPGKHYSDPVPPQTSFGNYRGMSKYRTYDFQSLFSWR